MSSILGANWVQNHEIVKASDANQTILQVEIENRESVMEALSSRRLV